ncbi:MAG: hypothetical protein QOG95_191 [Mycobacterium sp.]|jgi:hypothetical protein|nr:hypothetical protein [Mycobacterium sp.]
MVTCSFPANVSVLADAEAWPRWASAITNVTSTSPQPRGVGTTRTVDMRGGIIGDEEYLVWKPFIRIAFGSTKAVARPTRGSLQRCGIRARRRY